METTSNDLEEILKEIVSSNYLPAISGGKASWSAVSGIGLAVVAQEWSEPRMLLFRPHDIYRKKLRYLGSQLAIHFNYHAQTDPRMVAEVLQYYQIPQT